METELATERLTMRRARPEDLDAIHAVVSDFDVARHTANWPHPADRAYTSKRAEPVDPAIGMAGPVLLGGEIIGLMGLIAGDLGYMFARAYWGRGYATEIGRALIAHAWASYDWPRIEAGVFEGNPASERVLKKLGFAPVGDDQHWCAAEGRDRPLRVFHLPRPCTGF